MKLNLLSIPLFLLMMCHAITAQAQEAPPWLQPHVIKAYVNIGLTEEQKPEFNKSISDYLQKSGRAINKAISTSKGNLDREIRRVMKKHINRWNRKAEEILTEEQYPKYEIYRDTLIGTIRRTR